MNGPYTARPATADLYHAHQLSSLCHQPHSRYNNRPGRKSLTLDSEFRTPKSAVLGAADTGSCSGSGSMGTECSRLEGQGWERADESRRRIRPRHRARTSLRSMRCAGLMRGGLFLLRLGARTLRRGKGRIRMEGGLSLECMSFLPRL